MNYIKELNAFHDWVLMNSPSTGQIALWYSLMSINNKTNWKDSFQVPNPTLQLMTGLSRPGLDKARNALIQMGLIHYQKGKSNQAGTYKMISFYSDCQKVDAQGDTVVDALGDKGVDTVGASEETKKERNSSTLYKQNKTIPNETENKKQSKKSSSPFSKQVQTIWDHYVETFKDYFPRKLTLTPKREKAILTRLKEGYTIEDINLAITNIRRSPFHCGQNENHKFYADIPFICRDGSKIEEWMNYQGGKPNATRSADYRAHPTAQTGVVFQIGKYARRTEI
ncbi:hypothetical protein [Risungbinella massiliensis]|uniref:hypothetical protein n=1 Tax=Risungbinella massiliensis TaxID=1329796 RepID=UPI0006997A0F|nr:hypothetical protein [Risungbinella massiliensis]